MIDEKIIDKELKVDIIASMEYLLDPDEYLADCFSGKVKNGSVKFRKAYRVLQTLKGEVDG